MGNDREAGVAAGYRVADAVVFARVEEEHLVGFGDGLILTDMADIRSAVGEDERSGASVFFRAAFAAGASTANVANRDAGAIE